MADVAFKEKSSSFLEWFKSKSGSKFHADIAIVDLKSIGRGRGIRATRNIPADTKLFTVPRTSLLGVETSDLIEKVPDIFSDPDMADEDAGDSDHGRDEADDEVEPMPQRWRDLMIVLLYEYFQGENSKWKAYFDILPEKFDTLVFWSEDELAELQASSVKAEVGKQEMNRNFSTDIMPIVMKHRDIFFSQSGDVPDEQLLALCYRMNALVAAYAFELENEDENEDEQLGDEGDSPPQLISKEEQDEDAVPALVSNGESQDVHHDRGLAADSDDEEEALIAALRKAKEEDSNLEIEIEGGIAMVPMADMLNADAEFNAHLNHGEEALIMTSIRPIKAGEEILNYYGPLSNGELLRRYGYTSTKHSRYDELELSWTLIKQAIDAHVGHLVTANFEAKLEQDDLLPDLDEVFVLQRDAPAPSAEGLFVEPAKFEDFPDELEERVLEVLVSAFGMEASEEGLDEEQSSKLKTSFLNVIASALEARLKEYATTVNEDEELLLKAMDKRLRMAVETRMGEKKIAKEAIGVVKALIKEHAQSEVEEPQSNEDVEEGPPSKKAKR